ncbi:glycosyltransferase family 2 protein [Bacillus sp. REN3]|uniref:glycosyltransferase family 2 protein n=1 Tax=Bacillus sp. REN3 TaxID=2802440 RepID=UPI001AEDCE65|nr:glycosyltransferase family 2 protein [Bacillus sp. REN3]
MKERQVSILVPCYNEQSIIGTAVKGIDRLNYSNYEMIFINDGSKDGTFQLLEELLELEPIYKDLIGSLEFEKVRGIYSSRKNQRILVIDKENGGKADALNAGIAYASSEIIITLDADSMLDEQALRIINRAFEDPNLVAAGGMVHVLQGRKFHGGMLKPCLRVKAIVRLQILEYFRGFYIYKSSLSKAKALSIISGAFGVFKREALLSVGGYRKTIGEDIDITIKIQNYIKSKNNLKVIFIPEAICYTEVPENWGDLFKQRVRWQKAFTDCIILYFKEFILTLFKSPISFFLIVDALFVGVACSFLTIAGLIFIIILNDSSSIYLFLLLLSISINLTYNVVSLAVASSYGQKFSYREFGFLSMTLLADLLFFRIISLYIIIHGTIQYFTNKESWNKVERTGRAYHIEQQSDFFIP